MVSDLSIRDQLENSLSINQNDARRGTRCAWRGHVASDDGGILLIILKVYNEAL